MRLAWLGGTRIVVNQEYQLAVFGQVTIEFPRKAVDFWKILHDRKWFKALSLKVDMPETSLSLLAPLEVEIRTPA